ncbi:MAG TPA: nucleotide exchange factor GrpE [Aggregicoccus sp.]|nr:nucleotide exchange factor GrpE [Aggregicoccus sp.]
MKGNPREDAAETATEQPQPAQVADAPAGADSARQRLEEELAASRKRVDELARAYQALSQDREEFKQRLTRERERMLDVERGKVAATLLEAIDDLDRSLAASASDSSPLAQGVRLIREGLLAKVQSTGIERIEVVGKPFDPNTAEATDMEITPVAEDDHKVVSEVRAGYRLKDRVIRPARVRVAKYVPPAQA